MHSERYDEPTAILTYVLRLDICALVCEGESRVVGVSDQTESSHSALASCVATLSYGTIKPFPIVTCLCDIAEYRSGPPLFFCGREDLFRSSDENEDSSESTVTWPRFPVNKRTLSSLSKIAVSAISKFASAEGESNRSIIARLPLFLEWLCPRFLFSISKSRENAFVKKKKPRLVSSCCVPYGSQRGDLWSFDIVKSFHR